MIVHLVRAFVAWLAFIPTVGGSVYSILSVLSVVRMRAKGRSNRRTLSLWPQVSVLKPVCGLEKNLRNNLRSACLQDYPEYQVVFSVQSDCDPAIPLLRELQEEFGPSKVAVVIQEGDGKPNGKVQNLLGALSAATHEVLVVSDSDVVLRPDYLKTIIAPLADPRVGCVCTLYKAVDARQWFQKLEMLSLNADFMANVVFAHVTGVSQFCLGASMALRRSTIEEIGGLEAVGDYLVEDYEIGRRIRQTGKKIAVVPYFVDAIVGVRTPAEWWDHQVYWDKNTQAARPLGFLGTVAIKAIPFSLVLVAARLGDRTSIEVLGGAAVLRMSTAALITGWGFGDGESLRSLWLLPVRDITALGTWCAAVTRRTVVWRGASFSITGHGRLVAKDGSHEETHRHRRRLWPRHAGERSG